MLVIEDHSLSLLWLFFCGQSMGFQLRLLIIFFFIGFIHFTILYDFGLCVFQLMLLVVQCHFFWYFLNKDIILCFSSHFQLSNGNDCSLYGSINVLQSDLA